MADPPVLLTPAAVPGGPDDSPPWTVWDALALLVFWFGLSVALHYIFGDRFRPSARLMVALQITIELAMIGAALLIVRLRGGALRYWLVDASRWFVELAVGLAFVLPLFLLSSLVALVTFWLFGPPQTGQRAALLMGQLPLVARIVMAAVGVLLAPIAEEMVFRGLLLSSLRARIGWCAAWIAQALVFAFIHRDAPQITMVLFVVGLALGAMYLWRRTLVSSIALHAGFNMRGVVVLVSLIWINAHRPAQTWQEAEQPPDWWNSPWVERLMTAIPNEPTAEKQFEDALNFGSRGPQLWKVEARGFQKVIDRFPEDCHYAARALAGIQEIYLEHLNDQRRAVLAGKRLLEEYSEEREAAARAALGIARAYLRLGELDRALEWAERAEQEYSDIPQTAEAVQQLRNEIDERRREAERERPSPTRAPLTDHTSERGEREDGGEGLAPQPAGPAAPGIDRVAYRPLPAAGSSRPAR